MKKRLIRFLEATLMIAGLSAALPIQGQAASAFDTPYTSAYDPTYMFAASLSRTIDERGIYQQVKQGLLFKTIDQFALMQICDRGYEMPQSVSRQLYDEGLISAFLYKRINHQPITAADMAKVFDANYYINHYFDVVETTDTDEAAILQHFCSVGMQEARQARESFDVKKYKEQHPTIAARFGNDWVAYYIYYIYEG